MAYTAVTWTPNTVLLATDAQNSKLVAHQDRDSHVKTLLETGHTHNGTDSERIIAADEDGSRPDRRGGVQFFSEVTGGQVSAGGSRDEYLTDDRTSGGTNLFDLSKEPMVIVYVADSGVTTASWTAHTWLIDGIGHDRVGVNASASGNTGDSDYWTELVQVSSRWVVRIHNTSTTTRHFGVVAIGAA